MSPHKKINDKSEWNGKQWIELFKHCKPDITEKEADWLLWNETCYPFSDETAVKQIIAYFSQKEQNLH